MAVSLGILALFRWKNDEIRNLLFPTIIVTISTLSLIVLQYSSIAGIENLIGQLIQRLDIRGSVSSENSDPFLISKIKEFALLIMNYGILYFPIIPLLLWSFIRKQKLYSPLNKSLIFLLISPVVILHFALLNYSGHDFTLEYQMCSP